MFVILQTTLLLPTYSGVVVHTFRAYDPDEDTELKFEIISGNVARHFSINRTTGDVFVAEPNNLLKQYSLTVKVRIEHVYTAVQHELWCYISVRMTCFAEPLAQC